MLNVKDVIEILTSTDYLMLKYISCHLSHIFLCQHYPLSMLSFMFIFLQQFIHAALGCLLKGFFVLVRISRVPLEKLLILMRYLCIHSSLSLSVVTTRTWIYVCSLSCAQGLSCTHSSESCELLWHSDPSLPCPVCPWAQMF